MGEISRFKGELGENIAENFFKKAGWNSWNNIEFNCSQKKKHDRNKHGIDMFCAYMSPLEADVLDTIYISTKYVSSGGVGKFKEYYEDIEKSASCFQYSPEYNSVVKNFLTKETDLI